MDKINNIPTIIDKNGQTEIDFNAVENVIISDEARKYISIFKKQKEQDTGKFTEEFMELMRNKKIGPALWSKVILDSKGDIIVDGQSYDSWNNIWNGIEEKGNDNSLIYGKHNRHNF